MTWNEWWLNRANGKLSQLTVNAAKDGNPDIYSYIDGNKFTTRRQEVQQDWLYRFNDRKTRCLGLSWRGEHYCGLPGEREVIATGYTLEVVVHFPDLALKYEDEPIVDAHGVVWRLSTDSHFNHASRTYTMRTRLQKGEDIITGRFMVSADLLIGLEEDEDLRVLAVREIRKYLDRDELASGFVRDLPYRFLL